MLVDKVVSGGTPLPIPSHVSFGKYVIEKLKENSARGDKVIMINSYCPHQNTSKQLLQQIVNFASGLRKLGVKRDDMVALCSENRDEYIVAVIAVLCCGATVTPINILYTQDEIKHVLSISRPAVLISSESSLKQHIDTFMSSSCITKIIQISGDAVESSIIPYNRLMVNTEVQTYEPTEVDAKSATAFLIYSSGTTGLPKGVMLTHENVLHGCLNLNTGFTNKSGSRILTVMPWYHVYGLLTTIEFIATNNLVVYVPEFKFDKYLGFIQDYKIDVLMTVPQIIVLLLKSPSTVLYDLSSVHYVWCAAAPLSADMMPQIIKHLVNCKGIFQGYGLTETSLVIIKNWHSLRDTARHLGSCGLPLPGVQVKVVDIQNRHKLEANKNGEICLRGPSLTKGYRDNGAATRDLFDDEGFLKTGDIGYYDDEGYIYIVDRLKEIIKYKAHQVSPAIVEGVLLQHCDVADCGVIGTPDEVAGELPTAFVVPKLGTNPSERELLDFANSKLSSITRIRGGIIFVNEIPRNSSGKILRRELKKKLEEIRRP